MDGLHVTQEIKRNAFVITELADQLDYMSDIQQDELAKILTLLRCSCGCRGRRHTPHMHELIEWWNQHGIKNLDKDDVHPLLDQLLLKLANVPKEEQAVYLFGCINERF